MSTADTHAGGSSAGGASAPFARGTVLALLLVGAALFVGLLWFLGHAASPANNGGGHASGRGLNGYAALAALAQEDGYTVARTRSESGMEQPGVLVLTPLPDADGKAIARIVDKRRTIGPTVIITPKWQASLLPRKEKRPRGWTRINGVSLAQWPGFADDVTVSLNGEKGAQGHGWRTADGRSGPLPNDKLVVSGTGQALVPLVTTSDGRTLAAYRDDNGYYPSLDRLADVEPPTVEPSGPEGEDGGRNMDLHPVILVFEPDLMDNYGLANRQTAMLALDILHAAAVDSGSRAITFDLSLAGLGGRPNLLTLAFEPPFLAATVGLLLTLLAVGWRAFCRFGPPRTAPPSIPPGKTTLVANSAALIRRAGRLHLLTVPFVDALRERLVARLGLRRGAAAEQVDPLIDAHLARLHPDSVPFSIASAQLAAAHRPADAVRAAQALHTLEKDIA